MKVIDIPQNSPEWLEARQGKITGSKLKDIVVKRGTGKKIGYYQLLADRLAVAVDDEDARDRGHRLEAEAIAEFEKQTGYTVDRSVGMAVSDFNDRIAISPDGLLDGDGVYVEGVEVKCLGDARHIEAYLAPEIYGDYLEQVLQYFIVIETLERVNLVIYTDRIPSMKYRCFIFERSDYEDQIEELKEYQINTLAEIDKLVEKYAF